MWWRLHLARQSRKFVWFHIMNNVTIALMVEKGKRLIAHCEDGILAHSNTIQSSVNNSQMLRTDPSSVKLMTTQVTVLDGISSLMWTDQHQQHQLAQQNGISPSQIVLPQSGSKPWFERELLRT